MVCGVDSFQKSQFKLCKKTNYLTRPGVNFINVLQAAFTQADPKRVKKTVNLSVFFTLSGSVRAKAAHRTLMKLTPGSL